MFALSCWGLWKARVCQQARLPRVRNVLSMWSFGCRWWFWWFISLAWLGTVQGDHEISAEKAFQEVGKCVNDWSSRPFHGLQFWNRPTRKQQCRMTLHCLRNQFWQMARGWAPTVLLNIFFVSEVEHRCSSARSLHCPACVLWRPEQRFSDATRPPESESEDDFEDLEFFSFNNAWTWRRSETIMPSRNRMWAVRRPRNSSQKNDPKERRQFLHLTTSLVMILAQLQGPDSSSGFAGEEVADEMNLVCRSEGKLRRWPKQSATVLCEVVCSRNSQITMQWGNLCRLSYKNMTARMVWQRYCQTWHVVIHLWEHAGSAVWKRFLGHGRGGGVWMPRLQGWINFQDFRWNLTCREFSIFVSHHLTNVCFFNHTTRVLLSSLQQCLLSSLMLLSDAFFCSPSTILHDTSCQGRLSSLKKRFVISH